MADTPVAWLRAQVTDRAISVLETILVGLQTEAGVPWTDIFGNPYTVPMLANYPDEAASYPAVVVTVNLGHMPGGYAQGRIDTDGTAPGQTNTGAPIYGFNANDTTITLTVAARSDAERTYLVDVLTAGIQFGYYTDPATSRPVDQVIRSWLYNAGILLKDVGKARYPAPRAEDPRPEGERFDATLDLQVDAWVTTLGSTITLGTTTVTQTPTVDTGLSIPATTYTP